MITQAQLKRLFEYNPETGVFINKQWRHKFAPGERAGSPTGHGYRRIVISSKKYYEHHLAWLYVHGELPDEIDHINGIRDDNRLVNLRTCTRTQNCFNAERATGAAGLKGAYLNTRSHTWYSKVQIGGQVTFLGNFDTAMKAHLAHMAAVDKYHGEFALHNRPQPFEGI